MRRRPFAFVRSLARRIQANPSVSNALKESLGLPVRQAPAGKLLPVMPTNLTVKEQANGINSLKWSGAGNKSGVVYEIECKCGPAGAWAYAGMSKKIKFEHTGCTPGQQAMYRVRATRGEAPSGWSNEAVVYGAG